MRILLDGSSWLAAGGMSAGLYTVKYHPESIVYYWGAVAKDMAEEIAGPEALHPKKLHRAEILLSPLFWFGFLLTVIYWKLISEDEEQLESQVQRLKGEKISIQTFENIFLIFFLIIGLGASFMYRVNRLQSLREVLGLDDRTMDQFYHELGVPSAMYLKIWSGVLIISILLLVFLPAGIPYSWTTALPLLASFVIGPALVLYDLRQIGNSNAVSWGWTRWLFVVSSPLFPCFILYILHRMEHVQYYMIFEELSERNDRINEGTVQN